MSLQLKCKCHSGWGTLICSLLSIRCAVGAQMERGEGAGRRQEETVGSEVRWSWGAGPLQDSLEEFLRTNFFFPWGSWSLPGLLGSGGIHAGLPQRRSHQEGAGGAPAPPEVRFPRLLALLFLGPHATTSPPLCHGNAQLDSAIGLTELS